MNLTIRKLANGYVIYNQLNKNGVTYDDNNAYVAKDADELCEVVKRILATKILLDTIKTDDLPF